MQPSYDVVIIGGGVIGSSVAYHLTANPDFASRVAVIERDPSYAASSSSLSTSSIRQQFGTEPNIRMSAYSIEFLRNIRALLSTDGYEADVGLREPGYLILAALCGRPVSSNRCFRFSWQIAVHSRLGRAAIPRGCLLHGVGQSARRGGG
ncbi:MAG: FAD-dependent oxidoreductase, partial [Pseudomonadota bacterium]|nr:FAD-dependent oxidoreductase [Pseudomonadota bacterium]